MASDCDRAFLEPDLKIETARIGDTLVCAPAGDMHQGNEEQLRVALDRALDRAPALLAVDLSAVGLFTSSALNALLTARHRAHARGLPLVLAAPSRGVRHVLRITEADLVLPVYPSVERAIRHQLRTAV